MDSFFKAGERGSSVGQEVRAGLTTFLAMAYIIAVNPSLLTQAGIPATAAVTATCLGAGIMTILMGLIANRPLACASGMGVNAVFAFTLTGIAGGDWHAASAVIFIEGVAILILVLCGLREAIMDAIPVSLRHAISVGLALFIAMIGLADAGIIVADESTMVALGDVFSPTFLVGLISIVVTSVLYAMNVKGALLLGIVLAIIPKTRKLGAAVLVAVLIGAIVTSGILKPLIMRPRPCDVNPLVPMIVDRPHGSSFPSGHATAAFAAFGALLFSKGPKPLVIVVGIGAVLMALTRLYCYVHYPTDVLAGTVVGLLAGFAAAKIVEAASRKLQERRSQSHT